MSGVKLAVRYGFSPFRLGFCGSGGRKNLKVLKDFIGGDTSLEKKVKEIISCFEAAFVYYQLIARINRIDDPFDQRVVKAYWLGNNLLDKIQGPDLEELILKNFCRPGLLKPKEAQKKAAMIPIKAKPHHSFHVLFIGSITGKVKFTTKVRDVCRIAWGKVEKIQNKNLKIRCQPLRFKKGQFYLAKPEEKEIVWDQAFVPKVKIGETVSFHWGQTCQVLGQKEVRNLEKYTLLNIKAINEPHR